MNPTRTPRLGSSVAVAVSLCLAACQDGPSILQPLPIGGMDGGGPADLFTSPDGGGGARGDVAASEAGPNTDALVANDLFDMAHVFDLPSTLDASDASNATDRVDKDALSNADGPRADVFTSSADFGLPMAPASGDLAIIPQRGLTWVAWLERTTLRVECLGACNGAAGRRIENVASASRQVVGAGSLSGTPWVFVQDLAGRHLIARRLNGDDGPVPLDLSPPFRVAVADSTIFILGGYDDLPQGFAVQTIDRNGIVSPASPNYFGYGLPQSVIAAEEGLDLAYDTGECVRFGRNAASPALVPTYSWSCGYSKQALLLGDSAAARKDQRTVLSRDVDFTLALHQASPGAVDDGLTPDRRAVLSVNAVTVDLEGPRWDGGGTLFTQDDLSETTMYLGFPNGAVRFDAVDRTDVLAMAPLGAGGVGTSLAAMTFHRLRWDEASLSVVIDAAVPAQSLADAPRRLLPGGCVRVLPERCGGSDEDCDGVLDAGLCCPSQGGAPTVRVRLSQPLRMAMHFVGFSQRGVLVVGHAGDTVHVFEGPFAVPEIGGATPEMVERTRFEGFLGVQAVSVARGEHLFVLEPTPPPAGPTDAAMPALPMPELHWLLPEGTVMPVPSPCGPVLFARPQQVENRARIFCAEAAYDVTAGSAEATRIAYPGEEVGPVNLRWLTDRYGGLSDVLLVATGETSALALWQDRDAGLVALDDPELHPSLRELLPADRLSAIRLPGQLDAVPVRVLDGRLEGVVGGGPGFVPLSRGHVGVRSAISVDRPLAVSLSLVTGQARDGLHALHVHDLRPGGQPWGQRLTLDGNSFDAALLNVGLITPRYGVGGDNRPVFYRMNDAGDDIAVEGYGFDCAATGSP